MNAADRASGTSQVVNTHTFSFDHVQQGRQHEDDEFHKADENNPGFFGRSHLEKKIGH